MIDIEKYKNTFQAKVKFKVDMNFIRVTLIWIQTNFIIIKSALLIKVSK